MKLNLDLHIHSSFSPDSLVTPEEVIRIAKRKGLDGYRRHNTVVGVAAFKNGPTMAMPGVMLSRYGPWWDYSFLKGQGAGSKAHS